MFGRFKIIGSHGAGGKGVFHRSVFRQLLEGIALLSIKHFVLQIVGDAGGGIPPLAILLVAHIHPTVAGGKKGIPFGVKRLMDHNDLQPIGKDLPGELLP